MKFYIMTDLEGVAGVDQYNAPLYQTKELDSLKSHWASCLSAEINAAINGLQKMGINDILIVEGHPGSIVRDAISGPVAFARVGEGGNYLPRIHENWDALLFIGAHACEGTLDAFLPHTFSRSNPQKWFINNMEVGEVGLVMAIAGAHKVPLIFISGDEKVALEARELLPCIETAIVKKRISSGVKKQLSSDDACALIYEGCRKALEKIEQCPIWLPSSPYKIDRKFMERGIINRIKQIGYLIKHYVRRSHYIKIKWPHTLTAKGASIPLLIDSLLGYHLNLACKCVNKRK